MKEKEEKKERQRKVFKHGTTTQKLMSFRCDLDVMELLEKVSNKGRTINNAIREYLAARNRDESRQDFHPAGEKEEP